MRALYFVVGALVAAGWLVGAETSAQTRGIQFSTARDTDISGTPSAKSAEVTGALAALVGGGQTIAGPGAARIGVDGGLVVYQVASGTAPDVCITVRNLGRGELRIGAPSVDSIEVRPGRTRAACYAAPTQLDLRCRDAACDGVWRVDHQ